MLKKIILALLFSHITFANPDTDIAASAQSSFLKGINAYQSGEFESARDLFKETASLQPKNKVAYYNWGLSEMQLNNLGWSVALYRKALELSPGFKEAQFALKYVLDKLPNSINEYKPEGIEAFRSNVIKYSPWHLLFFLSLLFSSFWLNFY